MHPPPPSPTESGLGNRNEHDGPLRPRTRNGRIVRWVRAVCRVALVLSILALPAVAVVGPVRTLAWAVTYLLPIGVLACGAAIALVFLMWALDKLPTSAYRNWWQ